MRVLFVSNIPSPYRIDFFNCLGSKCNLTVAFERDDATDRNADWLKNQAETFTPIFLKGLKIGADQAISLDIKKLIKTGFDTIVFAVYTSPTSIVGIDYCIRRKIRYLLSFDGAFLTHDNIIKALLKKYLIRKCVMALSPSNECDKYIRNYAPKVTIKRYPFTSVTEGDIIKDVINSTEKESYKKELEIREERVIISVGQFIHRKGMDTLILAARSIPNDIGIYIIGGNPSDEYIKLAEGLTNIHFVGFKSKEELKKFYLSSDLFVLATREDIWGLVINEAMAYGLPIITTNKCQAGLELVDSSNGILIAPDDAENLSREIIKYFDRNNKDRNQMRMESLKKIRRYSIEEMVEAHIKVFSKCN